jgi:cytochrome c biogenesis protein CcmG/thiol:disulfide interchange protein DsbE
MCPRCRRGSRSFSGARPPPPVAGLPRMTLPCLGPGPAVEVGVRRDRPQLINVWASWCIPCQREMPRLQAAYEAAGDRVLFVGVDTSDTRASALDFLAVVGVTYPQVFDEQGRYPRAMGVPGIPITVLVDATGRVVHRRVGEIPPRELQAALGKVGVRIPAPDGEQR